MEYISIFLGFVTGVVITLIGAWVNISLSKKSDDNSKLKSAEYEMYLKLGDLYNSYFWFASNELRGKETGKDEAAECYKVAMELARLLHKNENTDFSKDLLRILYDETYDNYMSRWKDMERLSDEMAKKVAPVHRKYLSSIDEANMVVMAREDFEPKAPALYRFKLRA